MHVQLLGIGILGKTNEPLYMCDCWKLVDPALHPSGEESKNKSNETTAATTTTNSTKENNNDVFGFAEITASRGQRESLSLEGQCLMHSVLDRLEEIVGASHMTGTMPLRKPKPLQDALIPGAGAGAASQHWVGWLPAAGALLPPSQPQPQLASNLQQQASPAMVYCLVTATNIKFLALCVPRSSHSTFISTTPQKQQQQTQPSTADAPPPSALDDAEESTNPAEHNPTSGPNSPSKSEPHKQHQQQLNDDTARIKLFLKHMHTNYVTHVMNPFSSIRTGPIDSAKFDARTTEAVLECYRSQGLLPQSSSSYEV